ncbi:YihY/virulence factor BrkB family protein [Terriglobus tenax]|uniref:YihY/virulence factor BrkB family protein n=1 Tax=Terriglobus tenax TaxID=1111115 RepID=UPI0021E01668|nr:YihY/virulence factor BrkB family protein [Terriglobus tenax]
MLFDTQPEPKVPSAPQYVWELVNRSPLRSLWNLEGISLRVVLRRTTKSFLKDDLLGRSAQLAYYFLFALFPALIAASSVLGIAAKSATGFYLDILQYVAKVLPPEAFSLVLETFNQTAAHSTKGKITIGLLAALWTASVGVSALQDALNSVYNIQESRSYLQARLSAVVLTVVISIILTFALSSLFGGDLLGNWLTATLGWPHLLGWIARVLGYSVGGLFLALTIALLYYFAPNFKVRTWRWLTPGGALGISCWLLASIALRTYLHFFNTYSLTYGSLGAVIILLIWFYLTALTILLGAEFNSELEAAIAERRYTTGSYHSGQSRHLTP